MKTSELSSNQYYKGLNNRYDSRVAMLLKVKYVLDRSTMTWYSRRDHAKAHGVSNSTVMYADSRAWREMVVERLRLVRGFF